MASSRPSRPPNWVQKLMREDFTVALSLSGSAVDGPDTQFYENYS